ncbi:MAG: Thiol peroxidase, Bcp-type [uncultured Truepera sp.]|uniref:thioredoxin-dependent peroxiredoxin n=1 Tax=uncultured Truepera sp. TaxID=543023 RepID=A0A6J4UVN3_9DEIN|nr:MAG: Thiol peroxidase, Bcp-type [uncultured Truepera sp.]
MKTVDRSVVTSTGKLEPGNRAPDFALPDGTGRIVRLSDLLGRGPIVLYFYPKDNTQGCTAQACAFRDSYVVFQEAGAEVVGVSTDSEASHQGFAEQHKLPFVLLSDEGGAVNKLYGARAMFGLMTGRVTYIIDESGTVRHVFNSMFNATRHVDVALGVVLKLQQEAEALS